MLGTSNCPFCGSHRVTVISQTKRVTYKCCDRCFKQWGEPEIADAVYRIAHSRDSAAGAVFDRADTEDRDSLQTGRRALRHREPVR
jgi:hypothetical protein